MNPANNQNSSFTSGYQSVPQISGSFPPNPLSNENLPAPAFQEIGVQEASFSPQTTSTPSPTLGSAQPTGNQNPTTYVVEGPKDDRSKKKVLAVLGLMLMIVGIGTGVFLVRNQQIFNSQAWDCSLYTFNLESDGTVTVTNGSSREEPAQKANVYINGTLVKTLDVPALSPGEGATLGSISIPSNQSFTWKVEGTKDCRNEGSVEFKEANASCGAVIAYDENWNKLTIEELSQLSKGDIVRFAVTPTANTGVFKRARFSVNGETAVEVTDKRPGSEDFYFEYLIPDNVYNFIVRAEVLHSELGWF